MYSTFTVQPLLRGVPLDGASAAAESSFSRSFLDRPTAGTPPAGGGGGSSPSTKSSGIFNRNSKPIVESLDNYDNHLYLGTSDGFVLHYVMEEQVSSESDLPRSRLVQRKSLGFGKKVVERIMVLPPIRVVIVHLPDFAPLPQQSLPHIKGVTAFCEESSQRGRLAEDGSVHLCVTKRRTIQFYALWSDAISEPKELNLPNGGLVVTRWKNVVCVADASGFKLIDTRVGRMIPVLPVVQSVSPGSHAQVLKPVCIPIAENEFLLASATSSGQTAIGIFCSGSGEPVRGTLQWSSYPRALAVEFPYVTALLRGNIIEVHNILDQKLVQSIRFESFVEVRNLIQGSGLMVRMSTLAKVLSLQSGDGEVQQHEAHRVSNVLARVLIAGKDSVSALVTTPLVLHADVLLQQGRVEEALLLSEKTTTTISAENLHRERLQLELDYIYQKSGLIYLGETLFDDAFGLLQRGKMDLRVLISMFPDVLQRTDVIRQVDLFRGIRDEVAQLGTISNIISRTLAKTGGEQGDEFGNVLLANAKDVFLQYLIRCRKESIAHKSRTRSQVEAMDTALLGLWVDSGDDANLQLLLESNNLCIPDLCEQKLTAAEDVSFNKGLQDMATLLSSIQDGVLVEEYGWWIVEQDEAIGLKIFMPSDTKRAVMFDPEDTLAKLKPKVTQDGLRTYLEYIVLNRRSEASGGATMSAKAQAEALMDSAAFNGTFTSFLQSQSKSDPICSYRSKLSSLLQQSLHYSATSVLPHVASITDLRFERAVLLGRLARYDECLTIMVNDVRDFQGAEVFCLNAGVFRRPKRASKSHGQDGMHKESALDLKKKKQLFMLLLQEYLNLAQNQGGMALTLHLLDSQSFYLDIAEVIHLVPPHWSVELLQQYLSRSLRRSCHDFKEMQIIKGLSLGENLRISEELFRLHYSQGPVVITADDICPVCGTALADSVFMRTPDMRVIHLHCGSMPSSSPPSPRIE
ncbi:transforming growth factor, beta receptor associated protein 1 [Mortierella claussenii]|nr:transforming growth factor, beta receptor associated protein 1 [Mortierella claussenii]